MRQLIDQGRHIPFGFLGRAIVGESIGPSLCLGESARDVDRDSAQVKGLSGFSLV